MAWWHCVDANDGKKEIWVETDRWFDARNVGRRAIGLSITTTLTTSQPHARAYAKGLVYKAYWIGHAAGKHSTLEIIIEQVSQRPEGTKRRRRPKKV